MFENRIFRLNEKNEFRSKYDRSEAAGSADNDKKKAKEQRNITEIEIRIIIEDGVVRVEAKTYPGGKERALLDMKAETKSTYMVDEIAAMLGGSRSKVYKLIQRKGFKSTKAGNQIFIDKKSFDAWYKGRKKG